MKGGNSMIKFVLGPSGSGKTKWLIDEANKDKRSGNGNIVFIDTDDSHIFSLDHGVRLINASEYGINTYERLYGFLSGIISRDYDIEKIYLDGIYQILPFDVEGLKKFIEDIKKIIKEHNVEFFIGMDKKKEDLPENLRENIVELHLD